MGEEARELRSTNTQLRNSHGDVKHSIGNGVAKYTDDHGHKQRCGDWLMDWGVLGGKGQKKRNLDNHNNIIQKKLKNSLTYSIFSKN